MRRRPYHAVGHDETPACLSVYPPLQPSLRYVVPASCIEQAGGRRSPLSLSIAKRGRSGHKTVPAKQQAAGLQLADGRTAATGSTAAGGEQEDSSVGWAADGRVRRRGESCMQTSLARTKWSDKRHLKESQVFPQSISLADHLEALLSSPTRTLERANGTSRRRFGPRSLNADGVGVGGGGK